MKYMKNVIPQAIDTEEYLSERTSAPTLKAFESSSSIDYGTVADYYTARPTYPAAFFKWLSEISPDNHMALDCACGGGQVTQGLARYFEYVEAIDISEDQIKHAPSFPNVVYRVSSAEATGVPSNSVDLLVSGMAAHWFDLDEFYDEAERVLKPGGIIALWVYSEPTFHDKNLNEILQAFIKEMRPFGPTQRHFVENAYKDLPFPFQNELFSPEFKMEEPRTLKRFLDYMHSRSTIVNYRKQHVDDPIKTLEERLKPYWGHPSSSQLIKWPLTIRAAKL
jgi:SAM-dependent methyltransferase